MLNCPNCHGEMTLVPVEAVVNIRPLQAGVCDQCALLWFDDSGSVKLSPRSVLQLFKIIGESGKTERLGTGTALRCACCKGALTLTHDIQRTTRFTYWRCPTDHGQLFGFGQFLREKNFVRTLSPAEVARLRASVKQISCSQCGAPVNLESESCCSYCGAAIEMIDPDSVAKAVQALQATSSPASPLQAPLPAGDLGAFNNAQVAALRNSLPDSVNTRSSDLVAIGAGAMSLFLGAAIWDAL